MAASHYYKTWVKLNAPWSRGFQNKSKPDESIYWRSSPEHVITKPFLVDGDLGLNLDSTNALQGQQFIGESDVFEHQKLILEMNMLLILSINILKMLLQHHLHLRKFSFHHRLR